MTAALNVAAVISTVLFVASATYLAYVVTS
jgi:hypothetical protein